MPENKSYETRSVKRLEATKAASASCAALYVPVSLRDFLPASVFAQSLHLRHFPLGLSFSMRSRLDDFTRMVQCSHLALWAG